MASLKGSDTEKNLLASFAGESQARNRYTYFASKARNDGLIQIAQIFEETANQERNTRNVSSSSWKEVKFWSMPLFHQEL